MWLPIETAKWAFHKWKKCVGHSKWTRFFYGSLLFQNMGLVSITVIDSPRHHDACFQAIWSFPVPAGRLALWHCEHAGAREIPRKSTWKEAARTGAGSSAKNHGKLMVELLKDWLFAVQHFTVRVSKLEAVNINGFHIKITGACLGEVDDP